MIRHAGGDADDARPVQRRRDRPGDVRAVTVVAGIVDRRVVVAEVPAVDVVDVAVAVVVDAVARGVSPGLVHARAREVRVAEVDTVVDDRDDDARPCLAGCVAPRVRRYRRRGPRSAARCPISSDPVLFSPHSLEKYCSSVGSAAISRRKLLADRADPRIAGEFPPDGGRGDALPAQDGRPAAAAHANERQVQVARHGLLVRQSSCSAR